MFIHIRQIINNRYIIDQLIQRSHSKAFFHNFHLEKTPKALHRGETFERLLICVKEHWVTDSDMDIEMMVDLTRTNTSSVFIKTLLIIKNGCIEA